MLDLGGMWKEIGKINDRRAEKVMKSMSMASEQVIPYVTLLGEQLFQAARNISSNPQEFVMASKAFFYESAQYAMMNAELYAKNATEKMPEYSQYVFEVVKEHAPEILQHIQEAVPVISVVEVVSRPCSVLSPVKLASKITFKTAVYSTAMVAFNNAEILKSLKNHILEEALPNAWEAAQIKAHELTDVYISPLLNKWLGEAREDILEKAVDLLKEEIANESLMKAQVDKVGETFADDNIVAQVNIDGTYVFPKIDGQDMVEEVYNPAPTLVQVQESVGQQQATEVVND